MEVHHDSTFLGLHPGVQARRDERVLEDRRGIFHVGREAELQWTCPGDGHQDGRVHRDAGRPGPGRPGVFLDPGRPVDGRPGEVDVGWHLGPGHRVDGRPGEVPLCVELPVAQRAVLLVVLQVMFLLAPPA